MPARDMLCEQVAKKTPLGVEAKMIIDAGGLLSGDIMVGMTRDQLENNRNGYVYISPHPSPLVKHISLLSLTCCDSLVHDGFLRTAPQAEELGTMVGRSTWSSNLSSPTTLHHQASHPPFQRVPLSP
jgi:adenylate kinase